MRGWYLTGVLLALRRTVTSGTVFLSPSFTLFLSLSQSLTPLAGQHASATWAKSVLGWASQLWRNEHVLICNEFSKYPVLQFWSCTNCTSRTIGIFPEVLNISWIISAAHQASKPNRLHVVIIRLHFVESRGFSFKRRIMLWWSTVQKWNFEAGYEATFLRYMLLNGHRNLGPPSLWAEDISLIWA